MSTEISKNTTDLEALLEQAESLPNANSSSGGGLITHRWEGTELFITSDAGTSSADLQGPRGAL